VWVVWASSIDWKQERERETESWLKMCEERNVCVCVCVCACVCVLSVVLQSNRSTFGGKSKKDEKMEINKLGCG